jgi:hypothetical protein
MSKREKNLPEVKNLPEDIRCLDCDFLSSDCEEAELLSHPYYCWKRKMSFTKRQVSQNHIFKCKDFKRRVH